MSCDKSPLRASFRLTRRGFVLAALAGGGVLLAGEGRGGASSPRRLAVLDFYLIDTSLEPPRPEEKRRLAALGDQLRAKLAGEGRFQLITVPPGLADSLGDIARCNGCELALGKKLGADLVAYGWVQKVSNLILNINVVIEDVESGREMVTASADIRGNTDESWRRGLDFLYEDRIAPELAANP
jgi:hypothetical protein